ncbi:MAG: flagellar hook protein FlgE [Rhodoferax sp.]|uniref:flagellar hook protein FlgE n=1 Tax=Rhodoferax sp. TaxID=50421 RepID=UPI00261E0C71|nr:flagellar hook protein FlgE [Rhodoferax sp.]MDD5336109.1 flagellar hook protein FlgE [Rhodoferax sp.]
MSFSQGVSGLNVASANLDVIGNNIANSGTIGFKSGSVQFSNVYAGSMAGLGTKVSGVFQDFTAGAVQRTAKPLDVAIVDGDGFFRMQSSGGEIRYTRNGQFDVDKNGFITNAAGLRLTGYPMGESGALSSASPVALQVPSAAMVPVATTSIVSQFNLDATSAYPAVAPFDAQNSGSYNYSNSVTIFDSLGNAHELSAFFVKTAPNKWEIYATADGKPLATGGAFAPAPAFPPLPDVAGSGGTPLGSVGFDTSGKMVTTSLSGTALTAATAALATAKADQTAAQAAYDASPEGVAAAAAAAALAASPEGVAALAAANAATAAATAAAAAPTDTALASKALTAAQASAKATAAANATSLGEIARTTAATARTSTTGLALSAAKAITERADSALTPTVDKLAFTGLVFSNSAKPLAIDMTLAGSTQFASGNEVRKMIPDGYPSGQLTALAIGADGLVSGKYSNQQTKVLGQVVLSHFNSPNGLQNMGENVWSETPASGAPLTGTPGAGTTLGHLLGSALEGSNVDLTAELINLIIAQRTYQANTQTVKTQDQVVQALINMR